MALPIPDEFPLEDSQPTPSALSLIPYFVAGGFFGFLAIRSEIASWYRIYEMFRFESFHMYGIIGSAVLTGALCLRLLRRWGLEMRPSEPGRYRYLLGGLVFGLGWGLVGACPGPIYALLGSGVAGAGVVFLGALLGTYAYGWLQRRLPH
ncbi:MAG: YeeE/YedE thiosulfate transporter family protein [Meiothermus sp.]|uniref:DUF6691 family protein n=1 Tax=Meiothermus sp. TaxID=1955249 RepID=UPI0025F93042|nr:DUF6691 family protein [Meiothermus sp.]MCS7194646.1 YeeE/YedE thiosulfate transporter family protein [Meiothermus sp.]MCX7740835.1 YeeE/YedE thiosulfate transporter family protein [Meiothermus sp.]MDW8090945.1 YeeE/YedE thiosulfate transporter family protein [Meiothermus sp.]MDW8481839.1 YeeE/YedE thiosulfate transporter family protein [Meiothermus sp.]